MVFSLVLNTLYIIPTPALAYSSLRQSDWSSGYGQQVWSNSTKFNEQYNVKYQTPGELTISSSPSNWYDPAWRYRQKITINNNEQGELDHFPVLVVLEHKTNIEYWKTQKETGADIRFTDPDGKTLIPHDIERWDQGGKSYIWVKIPKIDAYTDTDFFYLYYGNPTASSSSNNKDVWDNKYIGVWHLGEAPPIGGNFNDSTDNRNNGVYNNPDKDGSADISGQIGKAVELDGDKDYVDTGDISQVDGLTSITVSFWLKPQLFNKNQSIIRKWRSAGQAIDIEVTDASGIIACFNDEDQGGGGRCRSDSNATTNRDKWYDIAITWDPTSDIKIFVDGKQSATTLTRDNEISEIDANDEHLALGARWNNGSPDIFYQGSLDEVRISKIARSGEWIRAEHKSESSQYLSFGHEELFGSELLSSIFDSGHGNNWGYLAYGADEPEKTAAKVKVRTGNNMYLADAPDFEICDSITNKSDISSNKCVVDGHRYIQYQVILETTEADKTPIFKEISITDFLAHPVVKGISTVSSPSPLPSVIYDLESPQAGPRPYPSLIPASPAGRPNHYPLTTIFDFLEALFH